MLRIQPCFPLKVMLCIERPEGATSHVHLQMLPLGSVLEESRKLGLGGLA